MFLTKRKSVMSKIVKRRLCSLGLQTNALNGSMKSFVVSSITLILCLDYFTATDTEKMSLKNYTLKAAKWANLKCSSSLLSSPRSKQKNNKNKKLKPTWREYLASGRENAGGLAHQPDTQPSVKYDSSTRSVLSARTI